MDEMAQKVKLTADAVVVPGPERIVRALAAANPADIESGECVFCNASSADLPSTDDKEHDPTCPWRLAREWVEANPG